MPWYIRAVFHCLDDVVRGAMYNPNDESSALQIFSSTAAQTHNALFSAIDLANVKNTVLQELLASTALRGKSFPLVLSPD